MDNALIAQLVERGAYSENLYKGRQSREFNPHWEQFLFYGHGMLIKKVLLYFQDSTGPLC